MLLPHADPAPCAGQICSQSGRVANACRLWYSVRALASIVPLIVRGALQQVGPADVADEDEVARRRRDRLVGRGAVGDEKRQVLRRVPRRVHRVDRDVADRDREPVVSRRAPASRANPYFHAASPSSDRCSVAPVSRRQLPAARHEIGVNVRLGHVRDPRALRPPPPCRYCSTSRFGSMTMASCVAAQPIR